MRIVIVAAHGDLDRTALGELPDDARVTVISWRGSAVGLAAAETVAVARRGRLLERMRALLIRMAALHVVLRSLLRLTPFDEGAWFWRAARRAPGLDAALEGADIVIAIGRDSAFAAWNCARRIQRSGTLVSAAYGYTAGRAAIAQTVGRVRP